MNSARRIGSAAVLALLACLAAAQTPSDSAGTAWTFGLGGGMNIPLGTWIDHPYAPGVKQFGAAWTGCAEIALHTSRKFSFAILGYYAPLATDAWTDYVASRGGKIEASGSIAMILLALRPRPYTDGDNAVTIELAGGVLYTRGKESYGSFSYDYTFLPEVAGVVGVGLEYERRVSKGMAVFARGFYSVSLSDLEYGDGRGPSLRTLPLIVGLRFRL